MRRSRDGQEHSHPGSSIGSLSVSAEEKHSTSAISESEEATNAPSAVNIPMSGTPPDAKMRQELT